MSSELLSSLLNFAGRGSRKAGLAAGGFTESSKKELDNLGIPLAQFLVMMLKYAQNRPKA